MSMSKRKPGQRCPLEDDWRKWDEAKRADRLFMSCPACGKYGSHVGQVRR